MDIERRAIRSPFFIVSELVYKEYRSSKRVFRSSF